VRAILVDEIRRYPPRQMRASGRTAMAQEKFRGGLIGTVAYISDPDACGWEPKLPKSSRVLD
jgi:hypothetical protein